MNELLIMQTQQLPVYTDQTPKTDRTKAGGGGDTFESLMLGAMKDKLRPKRRQEDGGEEMDLLQMIGGLPMAAMQAVPAAESAAGEAAGENALFPVAVILPQSDTAAGIPMADVPEEMLPMPLSKPEMPEAVLRAAEPVLPEVKPAEAALTETGTDAGMAAGTEQGRGGTEVSLKAGTSGETIEIRNPDAKPDEEAKAAKTDDAEPKTVLLSELSMKSLPGKTAQIKVGENYDVQNPEFDRTLTDTITYKAEDGVREFEIQLTPEELGKMKINVVFEEGKVSVTLVCENPKAQSILDSHVDSIRAMLETVTRSETQVNVQRGGQEPENYDGRGQQNHPQQEERRPKQQEVSFFIDQLKLDLMELAEAETVAV